MGLYCSLEGVLEIGGSIFGCHHYGGAFLIFGASLVAQMVKNLPAMQESWLQPLGWEDFPSWEDALEKRMATHSSILAWRIL